MAADVKTHLYEWSTTEGSNLPVGSTVVSTNLDDNLRMIQKVVRDLSAPTTLAAAGTTDLGSKDEAFITLTGTAATITALGTVSAGIYKWVIFNAAHVLTHNGTSLILPSAANITAASGDVACFVSLGSGNWRCVSYTRASGVPLSSASLSGLSAALAANTIANTDYTQTWGWKLTTNSKPGLRLTETTASTGVDAILLNVDTVASSTAWPLQVKARTEEILSVNELGETRLSAAAGEDLRIGYLAAGAAPESGAPGAVLIIGQKSTDTSTGGGITITGGINLSGGDGGNVTITGGNASGGGVQGTVVLAGTAVQISALLVSGHLRAAGTAPSITSGGGTGAAITGTDLAFQVTFGTGSPTSVTVDFATAYDAAPMVIVTGTQSGQIVHVSAVSTTQVQISSSTAFSSGTKVNVLCIEEA